MFLDLSDCIIYNMVHRQKTNNNMDLQFVDLDLVDLVVVDRSSTTGGAQIYVPVAPVAEGKAPALDLSHLGA